MVTLQSASRSGACLVFVLVRCVNAGLILGETVAAQNPQFFNASDIFNGTGNCSHGAWDPVEQRCNCLPTWGRAHITDTVHFFEGICDQYRCQSDAICQQTLNIPGATCPVKGWNCYCGWYYATFNFWHGYATTMPQGGGACMGVMYTFSVSISLLLEVYFAHAWKVFLATAVMFIGVGRKRSSCDHHRPTILHGVRVCFGCPPTCPGDCVIYTDYGWESFRDDIGWTFYIIHLGLWSYCFFLVVYLLAILVWSAVLWTLVVLCCIVLACIACCAACGEGMEGVTSCSSCDCCGGGCLDCCSGYGGTGGSASDAFYFYGPFPTDPFWGYSGYGHVNTNDDCLHPSCGCCISLCRPVAWLLFVFPVAPENMWGGVLGRVMGTHASTPTENLYQGGNDFIDFFSLNWRRARDLHENDSWRRQVHDFLIGEHELQSLRPANRSGQGRNLENRSGFMEYGQDLGNVVMTDGEERRVITISGAKAICIGRSFNMEEDSCVESSFDDYKENECWICRLPNEEWDMWTSCHHIFCKNCSTTMLQRRMPCPLCRVGSSTVLRGTKWEAE